MQRVKLNYVKLKITRVRERLGRELSININC